MVGIELQLKKQSSSIPSQLELIWSLFVRLNPLGFPRAGSYPAGYGDGEGERGGEGDGAPS